MSSLLDDLLSESLPEKDTEEEWEFEASTGRVFKCHIPKDADSIERLLKGAKKLTRLTKQNSAAPFHPFLPVSETVSDGVNLLTSCVTDPKLTQVDWLQLAKVRGAYFLELVGQVKLRVLAGHIKQEEEAIEDMGEGYGATDDALSGSESPATASTVTQTT